MPICFDNLRDDEGIYQIVCTVTMDTYIGGSHKVLTRCRNHLSTLRSGKHHSEELQRLFDTYGEDAFAFEVLAYGSKAIECQFLSVLRPTLNRNSVGAWCPPSTEVEHAGFSVNIKYDLMRETYTIITGNWTVDPDQAETFAELMRMASVEAKQLISNLPERFRTTIEPSVA